MFTNRRGRSVSTQIDEIHIGHNDNVIAPDVPKKTEKPRRRRKRPLPKIFWQVLALLIGLGVAVPIVVGESVRATYEREVSVVKKELTDIFNDIVERQKKPVSSETLKASTEKLVKLRDKLCVGGFLDNIAMNYPRSKESYEACSAYRSKIATLAEMVTQATEQMKYLEQLSTILSNITKPLEDQFAVLSAQQENWKAFTSNLEQMTVPATFKNSHAQLIGASNSIRDQWTDLVVAADSLDSAKYSATRSKIASAYGQFEGLHATYSSSVDAHQVDVIKAVRDSQR